MSNSRPHFFVAVTIVSSLILLTACGSSSSSNSQQPGSVRIASSPSTIGVGANWRFTASGDSNQAVTWTANGGGTIDSSTGVYIAPNDVPSPATVTITASSASDSSKTASTTITVQASDPIGTIANSSQLPSCAGSLQGGSCFSMTVSCPGAADISAYLKVLTPQNAPIGTVLFGVGTGGSGLYDDPVSGGYAYGATAVQNVLNAGYNTVQISFGSPFNSNQRNGWLQGPGGVRRLACRYATVADWVYKHPAIVNPGVSASTSAPMCATGNSGGSAAIAYAVFEYGLDSELVMIEPTSGPVMSRIDQGCSPCSTNATAAVCSNSNNNPQLCYEVGDAKIIDEAYRTDGASSPSLCSDALSGHPASGASQLFLSDSILYQGSQTVRIPSTIVKQVLGADDTSNAVPEGTTWEELISPSPASPTPLFACLAGVQHDVPGFAIGAQQIANDIIQYCK